MELNYKTFGQGHPIIILHGLLGMLDNWQTLGKQLAEEYQIYLVDQRNHGRSPHVDSHDYPGMAEDLAEFMNNNWLHGAHLIGHSMGGKTAMQLALDYPDLVDKLAVIDIAPKTYTGGHELILEALQALPIDQIKDRKEAEAFLAERIQNAGERLFLLKNLTRKKEGGFRWKMNLPTLLAHYQDILAAPFPSDTFDGPTLVVRGGRSGYVADADLQLFQHYFPKATLATIPDAGHWVHADAPAELLRLLQDFFKS